MSKTVNNGSALGKWMAALIGVAISGLAFAVTIGVVAYGSGYAAGVNQGSIDQSKLSLEILEKRFDALENQVRSIRTLQERVVWELSPSSRSKQPPMVP